MNIKNARNLALKLFGMYCYLLLILSLPSYSHFFSSLKRSDLNIGHGYIFYIFIQILFLLVIGFVLLFRTDSAAHFIWKDTISKSVEKEKIGGPLSFWIALIGIYFIVVSFPSILSILVDFLLNRMILEPYSENLYRNFSHFFFYNLFPQIIQFTIALILVFKNESISDFIQRKKIKSQKLP
ncbi:MAG: hypothetical protein JXB26_18495 [Candidatus Aminicenantes bacterium]|nr:hypothetical protein [Candidatus Aminicenantes bacterium]